MVEFLTKKYLLTSQQESLLSEYISLIYKFNKAVKLTSIKDNHQWLVNHLEDSVAAYSLIPNANSQSFVDIGSGNGMPGIVFSILGVGSMVLVDKDQRKAEFLKTVSHRLKLNLKVFPSEIESLLDLESPDIFLYRGVGPDSVLINNYNNFTKSKHIRFISSKQTKVFPSSHIKNYVLSDNSKRILEIST